jgi:hypothetical protein
MPTMSPEAANRPKPKIPHAQSFIDLPKPKQHGQRGYDRFDESDNVPNSPVCHEPEEAHLLFF